MEDDLDDEVRPFVDRKELWIDQSLYAKGDALKDLVGRVESVILHDPDEGKRQRARKAKDLKTLKACIEVVTCNLAYIILHPTETGRLVFPRDESRKRDRYDGPFLPPKTLNMVVDRLERNVLDLKVGLRR
jgi:hypothetical protein